MALRLGFCGTRNIGTLAPFQGLLRPPGEVDLILNYAGINLASVKTRGEMRRFAPEIFDRNDTFASM